MRTPSAIPLAAPGGGGREAAAGPPAGAGPSIPREVDGAAAERLLAGRTVRVLDVRTPHEFVTSGHIPGAILLPVDVVASAAATLPRDGRPLLVVCEHGVRSAHAARFLAQAGIDGVASLAGGMALWRGPREHGAWDGRPDLGPSSWLVENTDLLPRGAPTLDLACGRGRHTLLLAAAGFPVVALDRDPDAIGALRDTAARLSLPIEADTLDLEAEGADLGRGGYGLIVVVHFLHRPLVPAIVRALAPGGLLLYETYTVDQRARGRPTSPAHLLERGELKDLVSPLEVVREREGEFEDRMVAAVAARRQA